MTSTRHLVSIADAKRRLFVGLNLRNADLTVAVVDDLGRPLSWLEMPCEKAAGAEATGRQSATAVLRATAAAGLKPADIAATGAFAKDADAAAYGEFWVGAGRDFHSLVLLTLDAEIGSGIVIGDLPLSGKFSQSSQCGHMIIDCTDHARPCLCGQRGHLDAYASARAVVARTQEALDAGRRSSLSQRLAGGEPLTTALLAAEANRGDPLALEIVMETARYLGVGIVNLMHTVDPGGVLLGGAMTFGGAESALGGRFLARIHEEVRRRAFPLLAEHTVIEFAMLGGDAAVLGAAGLARLEYAAGAKGI